MYPRLFLLHFASTWDINVCCDEIDALIAMAGYDPREAFPKRPVPPSRGAWDSKSSPCSGCTETGDEIQDIDNNPFLVISLPSFEVAQKIAARAVSIKAMMELWSLHACHNLHEAAASLKASIQPWMAELFIQEGVTWRLSISSYNGSLSLEQQEATREHFRLAFPWKGAVRLKEHQCRLPLKLALDFASPDAPPAVSALSPSALSSSLLKPASELLPALLSSSSSSCSTSSDAGEGPLFTPDSCAKSGLCPSSLSIISGLRRAWFGREVLPTARTALLDTLALPQRPYLGPTSLDPELALLMANLGRVTSYSLVFDPFVGTGSILVAASALARGCIVFGSDVDYKVLRGGEDTNAKKKPTKPTKLQRSEEHKNKKLKEKEGEKKEGGEVSSLLRAIPRDEDDESTKGKSGDCNVFTNFRHYGLPRPELMYQDNAHAALASPSAPTRPGRPVFDAVLADPPYGIREPARKSKEKDSSKSKAEAAGEEAPPSASSSSSSSLSPLPSIISKETGLAYSRSVWSFDKYEEKDVLFDLLDRAAEMLTEGGRLVYLLPCLAEGHHSGLLPSHPCLSLESDGEEKLTVMMSRRIVTMVKTSPYDRSKKHEYRRRSEEAAEKAGVLNTSLKERLGAAYDNWFASKTTKDENATAAEQASDATATATATATAGLITPAEVEILIQELIKISKAHNERQQGGRANKDREDEEEGVAKEKAAPADKEDPEEGEDAGEGCGGGGEGEGEEDLTALRELRTRIAARQGLSKKQSRLLVKKLYSQFRRKMLLMQKAEEEEGAGAGAKAETKKE